MVKDVGYSAVVVDGVKYLVSKKNIVKVEKGNSSANFLYDNKNEIVSFSEDIENILKKVADRQGIFAIYLLCGRSVQYTNGVPTRFINENVSTLDYWKALENDDKVKLAKMSNF